jgi:membrane fusion protein (multidrug efflux system)
MNIISMWYVDNGAHVEPGQVLADIDAPQIDANLRDARIDPEHDARNARQGY